MKIKLAILENDEIYLKRLLAFFSNNYADKFEVHSFTNKEIALSALDESRIDVFIASSVFEIDTKLIPKRCGFAYFVDSSDISTFNDQCAISRYQKADLIYKQIISVYSDKAGSIASVKLDNASTKVLIFSSPCGGCGNSSMAAACAMYCANRDKKTLYLNLEKFGSSDMFFDGEGELGFSEIIYTLKSKRANIPMKLESCVRRDRNNVYFFSAPKVALDMLELNTEDILKLISELGKTGSYDVIVIDMDFGMDKDTLKIFKEAHALVWVGDGTESSNTKIQRAFDALSIREEKSDMPLTKFLMLIYNRFSSKSGKKIENIDINNIGGAPVYMHAETRQVVKQLSENALFEKLI